MQMRDPLTWIESSFEYFCKECKDGKKFCGRPVDAKCGPKHMATGDHETLQSWAQKFGNIFTRILSGQAELMKGGSYVGGMTPDGFTYPVPANYTTLIHQIVTSRNKEGHCYVALEDPHRMNKFEDCLGDPPGFFKNTLNITEHTQANKRESKTQLDPDVVAELQEILAPDIALYKALFPFLSDH